MQDCRTCRLDTRRIESRLLVRAVVAPCSLNPRPLSLFRAGLLANAAAKSYPWRLAGSSLRLPLCFRRQRPQLHVKMSTQTARVVATELRIILALIVGGNYAAGFVCISLERHDILQYGQYGYSRRQ